MKNTINLEWLTDLFINDKYTISLYFKGIDIGFKKELPKPLIKIKDDTVFMTWESIIWNKATIKADSAMIRNSRKIVCNMDFEKEYESVNGDFKIKFPEDLIRIG